jgi:glycosyltransferase involved in cell wall biosynthesis
MVYAYTLFRLYLILQGWRRAHYILCLGTLELNWMKRWFPWWRRKLTLYMNAASKADQDAFARIRNERKLTTSEGRRFLWMGRWASHKGTGVLLDFIKEWLIHRPQDSFTIAGCGNEAEKDCPANLLRTGQIRIVPSFDRQQLYSLLAEHEAGLFTSKIEGWGLVLNEMLESGIEVFATAAGATLDLQQFFRTLKPFPPPLDLVIENERPQVGIEYYDKFSWPQIAQHYESSVLSPALRHYGLTMRPVEE